jgi:hypothetical protein
MPVSIYEGSKAVSPVLKRYAKMHLLDPVIEHCHCIAKLVGTQMHVAVWIAIPPRQYDYVAEKCPRDWSGENLDPRLRYPPIRSDFSGNIEGF